MHERQFGRRRATAREAMSRPILHGATIGEVAAGGRNRGPALGGMLPMFAPDPLMPAQVAKRSLGDLMPEKRLMLACLEDALDTLSQLRAHETADVYLETVAWVRSDERHWPFSFVNICETVGLDPGQVRRAVLAQGFTKQRERRLSVGTKVVGW